MIKFLLSRGVDPNNFKIDGHGFGCGIAPFLGENNESFRINYKCINESEYKEEKIIVSEEECKDLEIIKLLLDNGLNPNFINHEKNGLTTFFKTSDQYFRSNHKKNSLAIIKLLLDHGADKDFKNGNGKTVLDVFEKRLENRTGLYNKEEDKKEKERLREEIKYQKEVIELLKNY